ncbi:hypothetical protein Bca101_007887 [Brassica carinata]
MTSLGDMDEEIGNYEWHDIMYSGEGDYSIDGEIGGYDSESVGSDIEYRSDSRVDYDIELYSRVGVQCHNLQNGTNFKFKNWEIYRALISSYLYFDITLEATDPATGSVLSFQTLTNDELQEDEWDKSTVHEFYKGPIPKWFSDEALERDSKKYYVCLEAYLPLKLKSVVVETFEDEPRDKLKANNAIFYLSYKCCADPCSTPLAGDHLAIVRKTMDGKPGHLSLETSGNEPVDDEWEEEDTPGIHEFYKVPMPKWFSDEALERDSKKYYVVPESELHDNDWLQLLVEVAFFSKADRNVVVETFEDYTTVSGVAVQDVLSPPITTQSVYMKKKIRRTEITPKKP